MDKGHFRVLVVDDYPAWRYFVHSAIEQHLPSALISEAADGLEAVQKAADFQPDLITLDVGLPKLNGIEAARRIRQQSPGSTILFITQEHSPEIAEEAIVAGGLGYMVKSDGQKVLLEAVDTILRGDRYISDSIEGSQKKSGALSLEVMEPGR